MERTKIVTLLITHECNLRCKYCYVRDYRGGNMNLEMARHIVFEVFSSELSDYDSVEFVLLGGEPFCRFSFIKEFAEWMWKSEWPKEYIITAVTNGTLLTPKVREWLAQNHSRFHITLSYDGMGESQNVNRSNSDSRIDLEFFRTYWPGVPVKMTISENSVCHMAEDIIKLNEMGIPVNDTFAGGCPAWSAASLEELSRQLSALCDYELEHRPVKDSDLLTIDLKRYLYGTALNMFSCGAGDSRITYDYDGKLYKCHLLSPLVLSDDEMEIYLRALEKLENGRGSQAKTGTNGPGPDCGSCVLNALCPTCEGNSFRLYGILGQRDAGSCELFKYQLFYACRFQAKRILRKPKLSMEDRNTIAVIKKLLSDPSWIPAVKAI